MQFRKLRRRKSSRSVPAVTLCFGVETEYGFAALDNAGQRLNAVETAETLIGEVKKLVPCLPHGGTLDVFTANGSRVYLDVGQHPEVATAECSSPEEAVLFSRAGDRLLTRAAAAMVRARRPEAISTLLWKANVDHRSGTTWASHESYLHRTAQSRLAAQLMTHLVTRVIYTGAGGFNSRASNLRFAVSPRAFHLQREISGNSTEQRGIFHTRDEPLAVPPNRRLHVLAGESLWSETADYLRVGTTALLVAQIDAGRQPQTGLDLAAPLQALATIAADPSCTLAVDLRPSGRMCAIEIQRQLLQSVETDLGAAHLPAWAPAVCALWRSVLDRLEASPSTLVGVLDWPTKLAVLERQSAEEGFSWDVSDKTDVGPRRGLTARKHVVRSGTAAARLLETDMHFNRLDGSGIFAALDREGVLDHRIVSPGAVERGLREPPSTGRARVRAACVRRFAGRNPQMVCAWDRIIDHRKQRMLDLRDPFQSANDAWIALEYVTPKRSRDEGSVTAPILRLLAAGTTREVLQSMRWILTRAEPPPAAVYGYCAEYISELIPSVPVPKLRRGGVAAGEVLLALFEHLSGGDDYALEARVGTLLYRWYEARGRYDRSREVIKSLRARAQANGDDTAITVLTGNLGYEYLLEGNWELAEPLFGQAIRLFNDAGNHVEVSNVRANLLECRFELSDPASWHELLPQLRLLNRTLVFGADWRARKTLRLLARYADHRGRKHAARGWMRKAIAVSEGVQTQLCEGDRRYLQALQDYATQRRA